MKMANAFENLADSDRDFYCHKVHALLALILYVLFFFDARPWCVVCPLHSCQGYRKQGRWLAGSIFPQVRHLWKRGERKGAQEPKAG